MRIRKTISITLLLSIILGSIFCITSFAAGNKSLKCNKKYIKSIKENDKDIFIFKAKESGKYKIRIKSLNPKELPLTVKIYDSDNNEIYENIDPIDINDILEFKKKNKYYIKIYSDYEYAKDDYSIKITKCKMK